MIMETNKFDRYSCETKFDHVKRTMTLVFNKRVMLVTDWNEGILYLVKDGEKVNSRPLSGMYYEQFLEYVLTVERSARELGE